MAPLEPLLTEEDAAKLLGVSKGTLRNWRCKNVGPAYLLIGSAVRYAPQGLRDYQEVRTRRPSRIREVA